MGGTQGGIEDNSTWTSHYVGLNDLADEDRDEFEKYYQHLDDELLDYDPLTRWGLICYDDTMDRLPEEHQLIESLSKKHRQGNLILRVPSSHDVDFI